MLIAMTHVGRVCFGLTIATYLGFFLIEGVLWTLPAVQEILLPQLNPGLTVPFEDQGRVLRSLFLNQAIYNLLLGLGGAYALVAPARSGVIAARTLTIFLSVFAVVAGCALAATTHAYALAALQVVFPVLTLATFRRRGGLPN